MSDERADWIERLTYFAAEYRAGAYEGYDEPVTLTLSACDCEALAKLLEGGE